MTVACPACDHESEQAYRCEACGHDLVGESSTSQSSGRHGGI